MKLPDYIFFSFAIVTILIIFLLTFFQLVKSPVQPYASPGSLVTNEKYIQGLYNNLDLNDSMSVFRYVFTSLESNITVYPTENYFYFRFPAHGKMIWGSFSLSADTRDQGVFGFGYSEHNEDPNIADVWPRVGGGKELVAEDGVFVQKINDFTYSVTFENKTVIFHLNDVGLQLPQRFKLLPQENYVGPIFDESGIQLYLIFNKNVSHLYDVLNEDQFVPETFVQYTDDILIGSRTRFAFYDDKENNRRILIGVKGEDTLKNNWNDGPHDQMPDNYVYTGQIETQPYFEAHYQLQGKIDKYGNYINQTGVRVAVAPYRVYFKEEELLFIDYCKSINATQDQFYK